MQRAAALFVTSKIIDSTNTVISSAPTEDGIFVIHSKFAYACQRYAEKAMLCHRTTFVEEAETERIEKLCRKLNALLAAWKGYVAAKKCCNADRPFVWTFSKFLAANESQIPLEDFNDALHTLRPKGSEGLCCAFRRTKWSCVYFGLNPKDGLAMRIRHLATTRGTLHP